MDRISAGDAGEEAKKNVYYQTQPTASDQSKSEN